MSTYLSEDQDLLLELDSVDPMSTGNALSEQQKKISVIHIKALLRQRKSADDVERSNSRFSVIIVAFTIVQIIVALCQFLFDITTDSHPWIGVQILAALLVGVVVTFKIFDPDKILKDKEK